MPLPWRTRRLATGETRDIIAWTDFPDRHGLETSESHADLRTRITVTGPKTVFVAKEIQGWGSDADFSPTNEPPTEVTLDPHKPTVIRTGWGKRAIISAL